MTGARIDLAAAGALLALLFALFGTAGADAQEHIGRNEPRTDGAPGRGLLEGDPPHAPPTQADAARGPTASAATHGTHAADPAALRREEGIPTWTIHYGGFRAVRGIAATGGGDAWAVDPFREEIGGRPIVQTAMVHVDGDLWRTAQMVQGVALSAIDMVDGDFGVAVGEDGAIAHRVRRVWRTVGSPTGRDLLAVDLHDRDRGWASGEIGTMLMWDGRSWLPEELPFDVLSTRIRDVVAIDAERAVAVTHSGRILERDAAGWRIVEAPEARPLYAVAARTEVGSGTPHLLAAGASLLESTDGQWRDVGRPDVFYSDVAWLGPDAIVIADDAAVRYRDGSFEPVQWSADPPTMAGHFIRLLAPLGPDRVAAVGNGARTGLLTVGGDARLVWPRISRLQTVDAVVEGFGTAAGTAVTHGFVHGDVDAAWSEEHPVLAGTEVTDLDLLAPDNGWAVGTFRPPDDPEFPEGRLWRWDGGTWKQGEINKLWQLRHLQMLTEDEGWASGDNVIARWQGDEWRQRSDAPPEATLGDFSMIRGGAEPLGFFGGLGRVFRLEGEEWTEIELPRQAPVQSLSVPSEREGWALMHDALYRWDGDGWTEVTLPIRGEYRLVDIDAPEPDNAWLLVEPLALYRWDGVRWHHHSLDPLGRQSSPVRVRALRLDPDGLATDVWLVGDPPMVARYHVTDPVSRIHLPALSNGATRVTR